jgi:mono/diheme cytochrome c family protein
MTRFNNSISVVDRIGQTELNSVSLHNPEPQSIIDGRPFLYDANLTSSNGEASCSSCHVFGDMDDLGWDLGNPDDNVKTNQNDMNDQPFIDAVGFGTCTIQSFVFGGTGCNFHPMKGPMTTQSLKGLENQGPEHWRGDRGEGGPGGQTANTSFNNFNVAFPGLVGRETPLTTQQMQAFTDFALQLRYPPNPIRNLDNSLTAAQADGLAVFNLDPTDTVTSCNGCHALDPSQGFFGGNDLSVFDAESQVFKIPHLRNAYQKVGMFGEAQPEDVNIPLLGSGTPFTGSFTHTGDQIRGFGFTHDGSVDTVFRFLSAGVFALNNNQRGDLEAFIMAFDSDVAPVLGQQVTLNSSNAATVGSRIDLLIARAGTGFVSKVLTDLNGGPVNECDLVAKLVDAGKQSGYLYRPSPDDDFLPDDGGPAISDGALRAKAATSEQEITYTCVPPGNGYRIAMDRDGDGLLNGVETASGVFVGAGDTGTRPDLVDTDGDGFDDPDEVSQGTDPNDPFSFPGATPVPVLSPLGVSVLATAIGLAGLAAARRRRWAA